MRAQALVIPLLCLSALLLVGCQQARPGYAERDVQPLYDGYGHARSLTLSTPPVRAVTSQRPLLYEPWYTGRRDVGPFVLSGSASIRHEQSVTYTTDRQYTSNGRFFDRYDETTRRETFRESSR